MHNVQLGLLTTSGVGVMSMIPIRGQVDRASATKKLDLGWICGLVKPKTIEIGIYSFPACWSALKGTM